MNPDPSKLRQQQQEEIAQSQVLQENSQVAQQFDSVEGIIRCDAEHTPAPPAIAERLKESIAREPKPARSWWQRLFSKG